MSLLCSLKETKADVKERLGRSGGSKLVHDVDVREFLVERERELAHFALDGELCPQTAFYCKKSYAKSGPLTVI
jgi:hypothetical protein